MNSDRSMPPGKCAAPNPAYERRRYALAGIGWVGTGGAVAAAPAGDAAIGVLSEASEASGQEAEAEEGGERQCEGAFHDRLLSSRCFRFSGGCPAPRCAADIYRRMTACSSTH